MSDMPQRVAVLGGGRMGAGIAHVFAVAGADVVIVEVDDRAAAGAAARVERGLAAAAGRGDLHEDPATVAGRVRTVTSPAGVAAATDLVVEAAPETFETKLALLTAVERAVSPSTILASNTSSLSIGDLAAALDHPGRMIGMHFFNPVPASALVEVVRAPDTDEATVTSVLAWAAALGKTTVLVRDSPGFATSRLGLALGLEAIRMVADGVADAESIDRAMELGYRHAMGPLRSTDLVGLDVRLAIAEHLAATLGPRFEPPQLLRDKVARGELGRKTGIGFFPWPN